MAHRAQTILAVHLILRRGDDVLLGLRCGTGWSDGQWHLPAGHVEPGESPLDALAREAKEELGLALDPAAATLVHTMHQHLAGEDPYLHLFFAVHRWHGTPVNAEPHKCADLHWFGLRKLPTPMVPYAAAALAHHRDGIGYSEWAAG
ncbi:NUDIX domain-containing protein [Catellatospora sp. KI3]|uniref:NUDIX hydrolase n=1 Tax=Catellatospora sp. KI3 TaxID=3041620 RepID=UPI0024824E67|nr:NUDIX domain-containing protein [Catellatospora sp. KI3]MDI1462439.1 NUDIX domain-containing protein [Catellatospora sp. KI3]